MINSTAQDEAGLLRLLQQIAQGRQDAFEAFYRQLSSRVFAFVRRSVDNTALAEEIMMDTLYEVWKQAGHFRGDARVSTWVLGIARNKALMALRASHGREHDDIEDFAESLDSGSPDGLALLEEKQRQALLRDCMQRLPWSHRECLHLLHYEDYSVNDIAALLEIPPGTVKSRLSHARTRLQACVEIGAQRAQREPT